MSPQEGASPEEFGKGEEFPELGLASENMMDMLFEKRLDKGELLPLPNSSRKEIGRASCRERVSNPV